MKKNFIYYVIVWVLLIGLFNVIVFVTPNEFAGFYKFDNTFWISYAFVMLSFVGQLVCAFIAFREDKAKKLFLRLPLVLVSYSALILSIVFGTLLMAIPSVPSWVALIVCVLIFVFEAIAVVKAYAASELALGIEDRVKAKTLFVKSLTADVDSLVARAQSEETKNELKMLYDAIRYSDPMSSDALSGEEAQITIQFNSLTEAVSADDFELTKAIVGEMIILINDRNKKCKLMK